MTAEVQAIFTSAGQSAIDQIRSNLASTGTNATGRTSRSLRYEVKEEGSKLIFQIVGKPFFKVVETGRKPTPQYKPSMSFVNQIKQWIQAKGIAQSAAYAIARNIHKKGTKLFQKGGRRDVYSNVIDETFIDRLSNDLLTQFASDYLKSVVNTWSR